MKSPFMLRSTHATEVARLTEAHAVALDTAQDAYAGSLTAAQDRINGEYQRVVTLCRGQLRAWARNATYNIFMESTFDMRTGGALRALFQEATSMLSPVKLGLAEQAEIAKPQPKTLSEGLYGGTSRN